MPEEREKKEKEPEEKKKRRKKANTDIYNVEPAEPPVKGPTGEKIFKA